MKEYVKNYEEAKLVIIDHAEKEIKKEEPKLVQKKRAILTAVIGLGIASACAIIKKQPLIVPALLPGVALATYIPLEPLVKQRKVYNSIKDGSFFNEFSEEDIITQANKYIDQDNRDEWYSNILKK